MKTPPLQELAFHFPRRWSQTSSDVGRLSPVVIISPCPRPCRHWYSSSASAWTSSPAQSPRATRRERSPRTTTFTSDRGAPVVVAGRADRRALGECRARRCRRTGRARPTPMLCAMRWHRSSRSDLLLENGRARASGRSRRRCFRMPARGTSSSSEQSSSCVPSGSKFPATGWRWSTAHRRLRRAAAVEPRNHDRPRTATASAASVSSPKAAIVTRRLPSPPYRHAAPADRS